MTGATSGTGTADPSGTLEFTPCISGNCIAQSSWWVPLVEQVLLTLQEHLSSPHVLSGVCVTQSSWQVPLVEQELLTLQEHLSSPHVFIGVCVAQSSWQVPLVEQELLTLQEHLSSPHVFSGNCVAQSSVLWTIVYLFYVVFIVCHSLINGIWKTWYLQTFLTANSISSFDWMYLNTDLLNWFCRKSQLLMWK
jgi:predicted secreted protein